ncbi:MAG: hypothetical protein L0220_13965 [Acidobacteria bacterium]|nr:hypothetical protein [Acidobacteriota bacterium]
MITNFDPDLLSQEERIRLDAEAETSAPNEISLDVRPGYVGGRYPLKGKFRLRGFHKLLTFLGRSIRDEPEYHVDKDPRTPKVAENPVNTMEVAEVSSPLKNADLTVEFNGFYYALRPEQGYQWNRNAFRLLFMLFQMTVTELPPFGAPSITISK